MSGNTPPLRIRIRNSVVAVLTALVLVGCGSSKAKTQPTTTRPTAAPTTSVTTVAPTTTSTVLTGDAAIIAAAKAENDTYLAVASENPVNPADPRIAQVVAGKQLGFVRNSLTILSVKRHHLVGTDTLAASRVEQRQGTVAIVLSCETDNSAVVDNATGDVVTAATNSKYLVNQRVELINGRWMVTDSGTRSPSC